MTVDNDPTRTIKNGLERGLKPICKQNRHPVHNGKLMFPLAPDHRIAHHSERGSIKWTCKDLQEPTVERHWA